MAQASANICFGFRELSLVKAGLETVRDAPSSPHAALLGSHISCPTPRVDTTDTFHLLLGNASLEADDLFLYEPITNSDSGPAKVDAMEAAGQVLTSCLETIGCKLSSQW